MPTTAWYAAGRLRLEAMRLAAEEAPGLDAAARAAVTARVADARRRADALAAAGADTGEAARALDGLMAGLKGEIDALLKDRGPAFHARANQVVAEVRDFGKIDNQTTRRLIELMLQPTPAQTEQIDRVLAATRKRLEDVIFGPREGLDWRKAEIGLSTRAEVRRILTPAQLKDWDDVSAAGAGGPATAPAVDAVAAAVAEAEATYATRLAVMRLAVQEGPHAAEAKARALARIDQAKAEILAIAREPVVAGKLPADPRQMPAERMNRARVDLTRAMIDILGGNGSDDFDRRVSAINSQVFALRNPDFPMDHVWVIDPLHLTPEQRQQIDAALAGRVPKLKQLAAEAKPDEPPAIAQMRRDQVALETRAAVRALLTPKQLAIVDEPLIVTPGPRP